MTADIVKACYKGEYYLMVLISLCLCYIIWLLKWFYNDNKRREQKMGKESGQFNNMLEIFADAEKERMIINTAMGVYEKYKQFKIRHLVSKKGCCRFGAPV